MGGVYLVKVWAPLSGSERREPMIPQVPQPLLFLRLVLEQFLLPMTARWMQIMNVNPASLFQGQTPKKRTQSGCQCGKSCLFALRIRLGSASFFWAIVSACAFHSQCVWESRTPAGFTLPPEVRTFVLYLLLCNIVLLAVMKGGKNGLPIWLWYLDDLSHSSSE